MSNAYAPVWFVFSVRVSRCEVVITLSTFWFVLLLSNVIFIHSLHVVGFIGFMYLPIISAHSFLFLTLRPKSPIPSPFPYGQLHTQIDHPSNPNISWLLWSARASIEVPACAAGSTAAVPEWTDCSGWPASACSSPPASEYY